MVKINLNRTVRDPYTEFITQNAGRLELTVLKMRAVGVYAKSIERAMREFLDSAGKAT
jgi:fructose-bisphosphate aldolase, class II